mgnify:CR=1 FL=1
MPLCLCPLVNTNQVFLEIKGFQIPPQNNEIIQDVRKRTNYLELVFFIIIISWLPTPTKSYSSKNFSRENAKIGVKKTLLQPIIQ